ncbi:UDP-N-acetylmuramoyl-L-alanine--D-glutamate ligase [bacterium]|nr:MAG: UDP-N-acetylmuramoyl-L-alanine--D-glutamate ligase [bacterium]
MNGGARNTVKFAAELKKTIGRSFLVVGLASTGIAVSRFLVKCGARVIGTDMRDISALPGASELKELGVEVETGGHKAALKSKPEVVIVSPGVPRDHEVLTQAGKLGAEVISDVEFAWRFMDAPVLAVAGTNGKSTTTELLGEVMTKAGHSVFVGGNIGTPAIEYAEAMLEKGINYEFAVLEISSFHLETIATFRPRVGVLLNITEDHLDRYKDFDDYAKTKLRLFENQVRGDFAVVNADDAVIAGYIERGALGGNAKLVKFSSSGSIENGIFLKGSEIIYGSETYPVAGFKLKGLHNMENIMAVIASGRAVGVPRQSILESVNSFEGLSHRMEFVREFDGVTYVDDSKGTNIGALQMALKGIGAPVVLIAGGRDKGGDYSVLASLIKQKVKAMILIGEARFKIFKSLGGLTDTVMAISFEEAVNTARSKAGVGDTVLLCPACSSFDMFKSYKERGERFRLLVEAF